ncbi:MAG: tetrathionate reductase family octaheme c-type cytochrome [Planctomycetes bacterium]|nr:tetrathionate reductase family octaheme c-type cytochrome [Planctomycetota bacterium]
MEDRHTHRIGARQISLLLVSGLALAVTTSMASGQDHMDHSIFERLQKEFTTASEVTDTCLSCHADASQEVMGTTHWTWEYTTKDGQKLGKKNVINNYCVAISSNEPRCTSCHVGYGYKNEETRAAMDETQVDCLICHDQTGTYKKFPAGAGDPTYTEKSFPGGFGEPYGKPWKPVDLAAAAQSVAMPTRANCGSCHFNGGGGANVKHGDLDMSMVNPSHDIDVHMDAEGADLSCQSCHTTNKHKIAGSRFEMDLHGESDLKSCRTCHADHEHDSFMVDFHTDRVACQTCHIPTYAKDRYVKTWWDWSSAGVLKDGTGDFEGRQVWLIEKDPNSGMKTYMSPKGNFEWGIDLKPEYQWFNGNSTYITLNDSFDPNSVVPINTLHGSADDPNALIFPVHTFGGKQPFDANTNSLVVPNLFPTNPETAYWKNWDWAKAIEAGQASVGREFSGEYGFVETIMYWPLTHQVSPADKALTCTDCHTADGALDFAALGYDEERVTELSSFPPGS